MECLECAIKVTSDAAAGTVTDITEYNNTYNAGKGKKQKEKENIIKLCDILFDIARNEKLLELSFEARSAAKRNGRNNQDTSFRRSR